MDDHPRIQLDVRRGDVLAGKYKVDRVLGSGGMGVVLAAHHMGLRQKVAIKLLLPEALEDPEAAARFDREARAAAKIKGEHIARIMDVGTLESGSPFMVMEYLQGEDLAVRIRRERRLPFDHAVDLILQTCEVLAEAHGLGIIHRDLKPANLFCQKGPDGEVSIKVLDFGISKIVGPNTSQTVTITKTSTLIGSPTYMSPEQVQSARAVDPRSDIWSVGVVLYELLAGRVPFEGDNVLEICMKVTKRRVPSILRYRSDTPPELEAAILKCLQKDRLKRYPTVAELAVDLAPFASDKGRLSVDRIGQIVRGVKPTAPPPAMHVEKRLSIPVPKRRPLLPPRKERKPWAGRNGAMVAAALGLTGIGLIAADLVSSRRALQPTLSIAAPVSAAPAAPILIAPSLASAQVLTAIPVMSAPEPSGAPVPEADCKINFESVPVSTVVLDGRKVGPTPKLGFATGPGAHVVVFEHPAHGKLTTNVECKGGETKTVTVRLGRSPDAPAIGSHVKANRHR